MERTHTLGWRIRLGGRIMTSSWLFFTLFLGGGWWGWLFSLLCLWTSQSVITVVSVSGCALMRPSHRLPSGPSRAELSGKWLHAAACPSFLSQEIKTVMGERIHRLLICPNWAKHSAEQTNWNVWTSEFVLLFLPVARRVSEPAQLRS